MNDARLLSIVPGAAIAGGFFAGRYFLGASPFALIVAPVPDGELESAWGPRKKIIGAVNPEDGALNTKDMLVAKNPLAKWAIGLRIGGFEDWYIPSRLELFTAWLTLRGTDQFASSWYWTSTQYAGYDEYAWIQSFYDGSQGYDLKDDRYRARAVRRMPIQSFDHSVISEGA